MPAISIHCTGCGARLKASEGKAKVRCPGCGTVLRVPQAGDEPEAEKRPFPSRAVGDVFEEEGLDQLEEVDEAPAPIRRRHDEEENRPRRRRSRRPQPAWGEYLWLIAVGVAAVCFFISFGVTLLAFGTKGLPENQEEGGVFVKIASLAFGVFVALAFVVMGVFSVKKRMFRGRWGEVVTGPFAVILGMTVTVLGGSLGGFVVYALLVALVRGR
jgi:hypothetical protein